MTSDLDLLRIRRGSKVEEDVRNQLGALLKPKYEAGASIRQLAEEAGRSYGFIHRILTEAEAEFRGRGGNTASKRLPYPQSEAT
jgi:hypothetical protein